jgi:4-hydroxyphenylpyruvate dioxygenase
MTVETATSARDLFDNPLGTDGFEFVEFTSPEPERLKGLFEKTCCASVRATSTSS